MKLTETELRETDYPEDALPEEQLRFLLRYAVLAPSSHNTQPWLFSIRGETIELFADRTRALPFCDPDDRELVISCGAALCHLMLAMRHFGHAGVFEILPDERHPDLLARAALGAPALPTDAETETLFKAIPTRHTNRGPFEPRPVPESLLDALAAVAEGEGVHFITIRGDGGRARVAELVAEADRVQCADKRFRRELAAWLHPNRSKSRDGIPGYAVGLADVVSTVGPFVVRTFDLGEGNAARDRELATGSPALVLLATDEDSLPAWIATGQALARVLLMACAEGVSVSFLSQPIEVEELRPQLAELTSTPSPQILLRLGYGSPVRATPRRPVADVLS